LKKVVIGLRMAHSGVSGHSPLMQDNPEPFTCRACEAEFKVVRIDAVPGGPNFPVLCPVCETKLPGGESGTILKYFLVAKPGRAAEGRSPAERAARQPERRLEQKSN
jgi:hypothetical protein